MVRLVVIRSFLVLVFFFFLIKCPASFLSSLVFVGFWCLVAEPENFILGVPLKIFFRVPSGNLRK
jgi:hypothetical protein